MSIRPIDPRISLSGWRETCFRSACPSTPLLVALPGRCGYLDRHPFGCEHKKHASRGESTTRLKRTVAEAAERWCPGSGAPHATRRAECSPRRSTLALGVDLGVQQAGCPSAVDHR